MACSVTLERLQCPITRDIMEDPVIAEDGYTYERAAITRWINDKHTSPLTRIPLRVSELRPNRAVKELIDAYREQSQNHQTATSEGEGSHSIPRSVIVQPENLAVTQSILNKPTHTRFRTEAPPFSPVSRIAEHPRRYVSPYDDIINNRFYFPGELNRTFAPTCQSRARSSVRTPNFSNLFSTIQNSNEICYRPSHPYTSAYNHRFIPNQCNVNIRNGSIDYSPNVSFTGNRNQNNYEPRQHRTNGYVHTLPNHRRQTVSNNPSTISNPAVTPSASPSRNSGTSSLCGMISSHRCCVFMLCCTILIIVCVVVIVPVVLKLQSNLPTTILTTTTTTTTTTITTQADGYKSKSCESIYRSSFCSVNWSLLLLHIGIARLSRYF
ncbi:unnamed protein product [Adineta ricciae]|uniref:U-box domain-containing protein n=1 Tax=Adineta ricciae TaxID=249248 RepID=A0A815SWW4_ADIRI|nr:unnamed protein product [Adineta ricciae]CAF1495519.1 unnamed protein product [Adineta ricciae]